MADRVSASIVLGGTINTIAFAELAALMLVAEKLRDDAAPIGAEGWKWIEVAPDFAYGHTYGLRRLFGEQVALTEEEQATRDALQDELDGIEETYADSGEDLPDEVDARLAEIETAIAALDERPFVFDGAEVARAGAFISIDSAGELRVERGYVRAEDELPVEPEPDADQNTGDGGQSEPANDEDNAGIADSATVAAEPEEDEGMKPIPDRLVSELTAHCTLALRHALGARPEIAFLAALHALCLRVFYRYTQDSCLELDMKSVGFAAQAPGLADSALATAYDARQAEWAQTLPKEAGETLAERARTAGIEALPLIPALGDFNDDLRQLGLSALADGVGVQLDRQDAERFLISHRSSQAA